MRYSIIFFFIVLVVSCKEEDVEGFKLKDDPSINTLNGTWKLISYHELDTKEVITKDSTNSWGYDVIITFDDTADPAEMSGRNTTNSVFGNFEYIDDRSFRIPALGTTYVNQPDWGNKFIDLVLDSDMGFEINGTHLQIFNTPKQLSALFEKE